VKWSFQDKVRLVICLLRKTAFNVNLQSFNPDFSDLHTYFAARKALGSIDFFNETF